MRKGWQEKQLGEFMEFKNGVNAAKEAYGHGVKFVNLMDIFKKPFLEKDDISGSVDISPKQASEYSVQEGDILFNRTSETPEEIACSSVYVGKEKITFGGFVIRGRQTKNLLIPSFAGYCFQSDQVRKSLISKCQGVVRGNIGQKELSKVSILVPPIAEQEKISAILSTWDEAIAKIEKIRSKKEQQIRHIRARLINKAEYERKSIGSIAIEKSNRNRKNSVSRVLSVTNKSGFVLPEEQFQRRVASDDVSNYKIVQRGDYAYNPSRINVGSIARLDKHADGILSPMYVTFSLDTNKINSDYFLNWLYSSEARQRISQSAQGSVRDTVGFSDLCSIKIPLPDLKTQNHIVEMLRTMETEISTLQKKVIALKNQKRGLMQKLLTGAWPVTASGKEAA